MRAVSSAAVILLLARPATSQTQEAGETGSEPAQPSPSPGSALDATSSPPVASTETATAPEVDAGQPPPVYQTTITAISRSTSATPEPVKVIATQRAQQESATMADVLARSEGVSVQQTGGLGGRFTLGFEGLFGDAVRVLVDDIPIEMAGFGVSLADVPLGLVDRIELYGGVVPIRFGADALGGVLNLVTEDGRNGLGGTATYQLGAFDTERLTLNAHWGSLETKLYARVFGFLDYSLNNYRVNVQVPDAVGHLATATVTLFHNRYRAQSGGIEAGIVGRGWVDRLYVRAFLTHDDKQLQNNLYMTIPYGAPVTTQYNGGALLHYEKAFSDKRFKFEATAGYDHTQVDFLDDSSWVYDWFGQRTSPRYIFGETDTQPHNRSEYQNSVYARLNLSWQVTPNDLLLVSSDPTYWRRAGFDRLDLPASVDPLKGTHWLFEWVNGVAYQRDLFDHRLQNQVFAKDYQYTVVNQTPDSPLAPSVAAIHLNQAGVGDMLKLDILPQLSAKASYEYATRMPSPDELFGDGQSILPSSALSPEVSHNLNLGSEATFVVAGAGTFNGQFNAFARFEQNLIVLLGTGISSSSVSQFQNVYGARSLGGELALGWTAPHRWVELGLNGTLQDVRNTSTQGVFGAFVNQLIPDEPYRFGNAHLRFNLRHFLVPSGELSLVWYGHYVDSFFLGWANLGNPNTNLKVPPQFDQNVALTWSAHNENLKYSTSVEVDNLTDSTLYDFYGAQRPGRAVFAKFTVEFGSSSRPEN